jgi:riboflavin synthase
VGNIRGIEARGQDHVVDVELPDAIARLCIEKGSLAVDGISLTIASLKGNLATFWITPHTWQHTNLHTAELGQRVNLEADMLAKHVDRSLAARMADRV